MAGAGTGSPITFMCLKLRLVWWQDRAEHWSMHEAKHNWEPTGRTRPYHNTNGSHNLRMVQVHMEYTCKCGHTGWTRHADMARLFQREFHRNPELHETRL